MRLEAGEIVGDYRVLEPLGAGGVGQVFRVEHLVTRRQEAMKVLLAAGAASEEQLRRFDREIRLQAALQHPNIAPVFNAFYHGNCLCMVMELLQGQTLEQTLEAGRLPLGTGISIARQVLAALAHAHSKGVIHRDISAANIMIGPDGTAKLTDFGLAIDQQEVRLTQSGTPLGSCYYMSPEQVRGNGPIDARTDIYSCGAVLFEIFTGRKLFLHTDAFSLMEAQVHTRPPSLRSIDKALSKSLDEVILRSLAKKPQERYPTALAFLGALEHAIENPEGARSRLSLAFVGGLTAVALPLLLAGAFLWRQTAPPPPQPKVVVTPVPVVETPPALPTLRAAEEPLPVVAHESPRVAAVQRRPRTIRHAVFQLPQKQNATPEAAQPPAAPALRGNTAPTPPVVGLATPMPEGEAPRGRLERFLGRTRVLNPFRRSK